MLKGDLAIFSLGEIFQSLAISHHSGTLKITAGDKTVKLVSFSRGEITHYADDPPATRGLRIGEILVRMGILTQEQIEDALKEQAETQEILGEILVTRGQVTKKDLHQALEAKTREEVYELFLLREGTFEFQFNHVPEGSAEAPDRKISISLNTNSVIMEGLRQVDEWTILRQTIPTFDAIYARIDIPGADITEESYALLDLIDGVRPLKEIFRLYHGPRFECSKLLVELLKNESVRTLELNECLSSAASNTSARQYPQAANYLQFASQLSPDDPAIHIDLGEALANSYQNTASKAAFSRALQLHCDQGNLKEAVKLSDKLLSDTNPSVEDMERIFHAYLGLQDYKKAASTGNQVVSLHQKRGEFERAAEVLEAVSALNPKDLNLKVQVATMFEKAGDKPRATQELEKVASTLEKQRRFRELTKVLRLLSSLNPKRQDFKQQIGAIQALQEKIAKQKKYGLTIAGGTIIGALCLGTVPLLYELKARENFNHARRLEENSMSSMDFKSAKDAYEGLLKNYSFSTKVALAEVALGRIAEIEKNMLNQMESEAAVKQHVAEARARAIRGSLTAAVREAEIAERDGDFQRAHDIYKGITVDFADIPSAKKILFPLKITSDPAGAIVSLAGTQIGKTPFIYRYEPGTSLQITVSRMGCETVQQTIEAHDQWELHFPLRRRPIGSFPHGTAIHQPLVRVKGLIVFPSRDGSVYAVEPRSKLVAWRRVAGRFGDRLSNLHAANDEVYLGTVDGYVTALEGKSGKSRWSTLVGNSVLAAPISSPDGRWLAVGDTSGAFYLINNINGSLVGKFSTENEILSSAVFLGDLVFVGSTDNTVYGYSTSRRALERKWELSADIHLDLALDGKAVMACTADGGVHRLDSGSRGVQWTRILEEPATTSVMASTFGLHLGTSGGKLLTLSRESGKTEWELAVGSGAVAGLTGLGTRVYLTLTTGKIVAVDLENRRVAWDYQADSPILAAPLLIDGILYIVGSSGKIELLEVVG
ncbi:MAG TPA: DUF4388 domain-containing protein [Planctomycetota bacterium]|nr:DUF4388 domain-containing protein [Planctomycetota bacterium]